MAEERSSEGRDGSHDMSFCVYGGASFPVGPFAGMDNLNYGFAKNGFALSAEYSLHLARHLSWTTSLTYSHNPFDESSMRRRFISNEPGIDMYFGSYTLLFPMTGISGQHNMGEMVAAYATLQVGWLFGFEPDMHINYRGRSIFAQKARNANALALSFSAGIQLLDNVRIGMKYLGSKPSYDGTYYVETSLIQIVVGVGF
jgi:hypothetical protein